MSLSPDCESHSGGKQTNPNYTRISQLKHPPSAVCTGTAPASFVPPGPTATAVSYVPNAYFSFPYVATYFANGGFCSAAVSQCSANYEACTEHLGGQGGGGGGGGGYAVTIVVPGGGGTTVTAAAGATYDAASATSICKIVVSLCDDNFRIPYSMRYLGNSLSSAACNGLESSMCTLSGTTTAGFYFGTESGNGAARPTVAACVGLVGAVAAGVAGLGIL